MPHTCPVCAYPNLTEAPRSKSGGGSYEICPSCGFEFGVSDDDLGHTYESWRKQWVANGMKWSSRGHKQPADWNPAKQSPATKAKAPAKATKAKSAKAKSQAKQAKSKARTPASKKPSKK